MAAEVPPAIRGKITAQIAGAQKWAIMFLCCTCDDTSLCIQMCISEQIARMLAKSDLNFGRVLDS